MTPRAFFNSVKGFEAIRHTDLEVARLQTFHSVNVWAQKPIKDPKQLWKYSWEEKETDKKTKTQKAEKFRNRIKRHGG